MSLPERSGRTMLSSSPFVLNATSTAGMTTSYVFISDWMAQDIIVLRADPATGNLTFVTTVPLQSPQTLKVDPRIAGRGRR